MRVDTAREQRHTFQLSTLRRSSVRKRNQSSSSAERVVVNYTTKEPEHLPRTNDHAVAHCHVVVLEVPDIQEAVNYHKVTLEESETDPQPKSQW